MSAQPESYYRFTRRLQAIHAQAHDAALALTRAKDGQSSKEALELLNRERRRLWAMLERIELRLAA